MKLNIEIEKIAVESGLSIEEIAERLFPLNKYPMAAMQRILSGEAELDANQLLSLSSLTGKNIDQLFETNWKAESKSGLHIFTREDYKAVLDINKNVTRVLHKDSAFYDSIIHKDSVSVREYLVSIDEIINQHKSKQQ
jgi:hypothetical protein